MKKSKMRSNLDEMKEQELLKIEHNGFWLVFWGLLAAICIQIFIGGKEVRRNIAAEQIIFFGVAIYMVAACLKRGIWDRTSQPKPKTILLQSVVAGLITGAVFAVLSYFKYYKIGASIAVGVFLLAVISVLSFVALTAAGAVYSARHKKLEMEEEQTCPPENADRP